MKNMRMQIGVLSISTIVAAVLVISGCGKSGGGSGLSSGGGGTTSAEKNSFKEVTAHLDPGGNFYLYLSTEQWLTGLSDKISDWRGIAAEIPGMNPDDQKKVGQVFDVVTSLVKHSGVEEVSGLGVSSIEREKGLYRTVSILHHYPDKNTGYLWSLMGKQAHSLEALDLLPQNTAFAAFSDLDTPMLWSILNKEISQSGIPEAQAVMQSIPDQFFKATGIKLDQMLASLGGAHGIVLTLDDTHMISVPTPGQGPAMQIPEPAIMIIFKVKDNTIFDWADAKINANPQVKQQVINRDTGDLKMRTVPVPVPLPISLRPTLARGGDYLFLASTDAIIEEAMAVKAGKKPGLKSTEEFKKLSQGIPDKGNGFSFLSEKFGKTIQDFQSQALQAGSAQNPAQANMLKKVMALSSSVATAYSVTANGEDGIITIGNGSQDPSKIALLVPVAAAGVVAGLALPAIAKARVQAQQASANAQQRQMQRQQRPQVQPGQPQMQPQMPPPGN